MDTIKVNESEASPRGKWCESCRWHIVLTAPHDGSEAGEAIDGAHSIDMALGLIDDHYNGWPVEIQPVA
jgi:hypothetical protein